MHKVREPTEVPALKNGQAAPRSVRMPDSRKKEGLKPLQHCQIARSLACGRRHRARATCERA
eukprot:4168742-Pleurochrysis_carterae.AAC.1